MTKFQCPVVRWGSHRRRSWVSCRPDTPRFDERESCNGRTSPSRDLTTVLCILKLQTFAQAQKYAQNLHKHQFQFIFWGLAPTPPIGKGTAHLYVIHWTWTPHFSKQIADRVHLSMSRDQGRRQVKNVGWTQMANAKREPITVFWGRSRGPRAEGSP